jgi:hypothetical protein
MQILDKQNGYTAFPSCATRLDTGFCSPGSEVALLRSLGFSPDNDWDDSNALWLLLTELIYADCLLFMSE